MTDDDFESRLRAALTTPHASDRVDTDSFLADVHHGARVRRLKRQGGIVAASVVLLAGAGGLLVNVAGLLDTNTSQSASTPERFPPDGGASQSDMGGAAPTAAKGMASAGADTYALPYPPGQRRSVPVQPQGSIAADEVTALSLTATGSDHQWVLAKTPGRDCGRPSCASLFATDDHGGRWQNLGQLPAPPASSDDPTPQSVSQVRFAKRDDTTYDGWVFGDSLWSTHDSGRTWTQVFPQSTRVTALEASGGVVYAGVSALSGTPRASLLGSPTSTDDWTPIKVGARLTDVQALAASMGVVALIDTDGSTSRLFVSQDGRDWQPDDSACPNGSKPSALSTASDATRGIGSLWVTCTSPTATYIRYEDTDRWGQWMTAQGSFGPGVVVGARTPMEGFVAGPGIAGIASVSSAATVRPTTSADVGAATFIGFTNITHGYLLNSAGQMFSTTDSGSSWQPYAVSDTKP